MQFSSVMATHLTNNVQISPPCSYPAVSLFSFLFTSVALRRLDNAEKRDIAYVLGKYLIHLSSLLPIFAIHVSWLGYSCIAAVLVLISAPMAKKKEDCSTILWWCWNKWFHGLFFVSEHELPNSRHLNLTWFRENATLSPLSPSQILITFSWRFAKSSLVISWRNLCSFSTTSFKRRPKVQPNFFRSLHAGPIPPTLH